MQTTLCALRLPNTARVHLKSKTEHTFVVESILANRIHIYVCVCVRVCVTIFIYNTDTHTHLRMSRERWPKRSLRVILFICSFYLFVEEPSERTYLRALASLKARTLQETGKLRVRNSITALFSFPRSLIEKDRDSDREKEDEEEREMAVPRGARLKMSATLRTATEKTILPRMPERILHSDS